MNESDVKTAILEQIEDAVIEFNGQGCNLEVTIVSEIFAGKTPVKRQQTVYACLAPYIESGELHAVSMKTYTPEQWQKR